MRRATSVILVLLVGLAGTLAWSATKYHESPMLADLVAKGQLPPVDQRLPEDPPVLTPVEGVGQYGGTLHLAATSNLPWEDLGELPERGTYMLKIDAKGNIVPDLAKDYKLAADGKSFTLYLRKGVKWSDGVPFTADDIVFMFEDLHWNKAGMQTWNLMPDVKRVIKVDDYTVRFETDVPYPVILIKLTGPGGGDWFLFQPKHYLQKWHIKYNPDADKLAQSEGFKSWSEALYYHYWWSPQKDLDKPTLQPWILKEFTTTTKVSVRNPYYWKVDTAGNQLPYVDRLESTILADQEAYNLKIISSELDVAFIHTSFEDYTLFKENEAKGGYRTVTIPGLNGSEMAISVNVNYPDPVLRPVYANVKFRQALSLAMNRSEINNVIFLGKAVPRQATVLPSVRYYNKAWAEAFTQYDPKTANTLLDEVGLNKRDADGFRIGPDGKTFNLIIEYPAAGSAEAGKQKMLELVKEYWEKVGLKTMLKPEDQSLINEKKGSNNHELFIGTVDACDEIRNYESGGEYWQGGGSDFSWANSWGQWIAADREIKAKRKTLADYGGKMPGEKPPADHLQAQEWITQRNQAPFGSSTYMDLSRKFFDYAAKQMFLIGTVGMAPQIFIAKTNIGNVPTSYKAGMTWAGDLNYFSDQLYIKK